MRLLLVWAFALSACATAKDPGDGGFVSGVVGIAGGEYDQRIDERESRVEEAESKQEALTTETNAVRAASEDAADELVQLEGEHAALKRRIVKLRSELAAKNIELDDRMKKRVNSSIASKRQGESGDRAAVLRKAIADARALATELADLSS